MRPVLSIQVILEGSPSFCAPDCCLTGLLIPGITWLHCSALLCYFLFLSFFKIAKMTILASLDFLTPSLEGDAASCPCRLCTLGCCPSRYRDPSSHGGECTSARGGTATTDLSARALLQLFQPGCLLQSGRQQWTHAGTKGLERSRLSPLVCGLTSSLRPSSIFLGQPAPARSHQRG